LNKDYGKWGDVFNKLKEAKEKPEIPLQEKLTSSENINKIRDY
jgi:hypothetical protein